MSRYQSARSKLRKQSITVALMVKAMRSYFSKLNDFNSNSADYEELLIELNRWGIRSYGSFIALIQKHKKALLESDSARMSEREIAFHCSDLSVDEQIQFRRHVRQRVYFAYQGLIRSALELEFGDEANPVIEMNE
ncbi:hypothetical protein NT239_11260 [Chitinibacter sp. SCUT-21]|uniref:hypothetical protein n=1 Tax=Chitinibacter sp. SCUT-21 TaxID=2970891 RepID=UPI0035A6EC22